MDNLKLQVLTKLQDLAMHMKESYVIQVTANWQEVEFQSQNMTTLSL